ncbi:DNA polymerase III subunit delta [Actinobacillus delphinicola]|uniref:DNA polymerase III subunit delta n=1 Tax=Actinobacillus delphinicola TaxID=51161 RepID=UPI002442CFBB|nr:DNA polymerase III subunit delta [Actinobacillus delphinicola]MDG6897690.1 DNA polymerase III subunit delta [Actinobacillus delphinicola]
MRRIASDQLSFALQKGLPPVCILTGSDPLLLIEAEDMLCQYASEQGFDEKYRQTIENTTDWDSILERVQSMGLFFQRQIIYLQLPENLNAAIQNQLQVLIEHLNEDCLLILHLPKFNKNVEKQKWVVALEKFAPQSWLVNCQTPTLEALPQWISIRARQLELEFDQESIQLLCYNYEGNLLALKQVLSLLSLLYPASKITLPRVQQVIEQSAVFSVYQWVDALLSGDALRAKQILSALQQDDTQPVILLRSLQREIMMLLQITQPYSTFNMDMPLDLSGARARFDELRIWQNRRNLLLQAAKRFTYRRIFEIIQELAVLERAVKQDFNQNVWQELTLLSYHFCQPN